MRGSEASAPGAFWDAPSTLATSIRTNPPSLETDINTYPVFDQQNVASKLERRFPTVSWDQGNNGPISASGNSTGKGILIGVLSAFGSAAVAVLVLAAFFFFKYTRRGRILLDRMGRPGEFDDEQAFLREEAEALETMDDLSRSEYLRSKGMKLSYLALLCATAANLLTAFVEANPPESTQTDISLSQFLAIQEKGVSAWEFQPELEIANCFVEGRTEIEFYDSICSVQTNLPVPKQNDVYYWEAKIYDKPETTHIGIGMSTKPYPLFRLPGMCHPDLHRPDFGSS